MIDESKVNDITQFREVYNELTDAISRARHQFLPSRLKEWFAYLDENPQIQKLIMHLQEALNFDIWYAAAKETGGSFVGSASLDWPDNKQDALGMKLLLFRAAAEKKLDISQVGYTFIYVGNNINDNAQAFIEQVFMPMASELRRYLENELAKPNISAPASDRVVSLDHNRGEYREAIESLDKLIKTIKESNAYEDIEEKDQRVAEVSAARRLMDAARVRIEPLAALLKPLFVQFGAKLKDTLVGMAVSATIAVFVILFGKLF